MSAGKNMLVFGKKKLLVMVIAALMMGTGYLAFAPGMVKANPATLFDQMAGPSPVAETGMIGAISNWTHVNAPPHVLNMAEFYFQAAGTPGCTGTQMPGLPQWNPIASMWVAFWQNLVVNTLPDYTVPGPYEVTMRVQSMGDAGDPTWSACTPPIPIDVTGPDTDPPYVAGHGITPPTGSAPRFSVNPASTTTTLQYTVTDEPSGGSFITDAEYFRCGPTPSSCGPDPSWVDDTGVKPDTPLPNDPWWPIPPPPPQTWDSRARMYLENVIDVSGWGLGTYWFYIHGADCGVDTVCESGVSGSDDNWGDFQNAGQQGTRWFEVSLVVSAGGNNPPTLDWTGEPNFVSDGINPDSGDPSTTFEYRINYTDADNEAPTNMDVHIEIPCGVPWGADAYPMKEVDPLDTDVTDGKLYNFTVILGAVGIYAYYFNASDGTDLAVGTPTIPCSPGPTVTSGGNNAPTLSWTGEPGFVTDGVNPDAGDLATTFEYRVNYTDADNDPPLAMNGMYIEKPCGTPWGASPFMLNPVNPLDTDFTDGALFYFTTMLSPVGTDYGYYFNASDGTDWATGDPTKPCTAGPDVSSSLPPSPPPNLWVERSNPDIIVHWDAVTGADSYNVYRSNDRHALFSTWTSVVEPTTSWTHLGAYGDTNTWYYIVRADNTTAGESTNSTMGVKLHKDLGMPSGIPGRNLYWISIPYVSSFRKASDIVMDIEGSMGAPSMINAVCKWNPATQNVMMFLYAGRWRGPDFVINPGDGICINSINAAWTWVLNGTDTRTTLGFIYNLVGGNGNWISMPYTNAYMTASNIVRDIEGSLINPPTKITVVAMWDPAAQALVKYEWTGAAWTGTDFNIDSGDGLYLDILTTFTWQPDLITPSVP